MQFKSIIATVAALAVGNARAGPLAFPFKDSTQGLSPAVNALSARSENAPRDEKIFQYDASIQTPSLGVMTSAACTYAATYANQIPTDYQLEQYYYWRSMYPSLSCWSACPYPSGQVWGYQQYYWLGMCSYFPTYTYVWDDSFDNGFCLPLLC